MIARVPLLLKFFRVVILHVLYNFQQYSGMIGSPYILR